jgi:hypothetical protein
LKARVGFAGEDRAELLKVENMLRTFAATERDSVSDEDDTVPVTASEVAVRLVRASLAKKVQARLEPFG